MSTTAYNEDPSNARLALTSSSAFAAEGMHELSMLLAEKGLELDPDEDTKVGLLERCSISGFYSKLPSRKLKGKTACETLATDKARSWHTKNLARQNSTYYASSASDLMPKTRLQPVNFIPPYDYAPMNPSITSYDGSLWMIQRSVNYRIRPDGSYDMRGDNAIRTVNYLMRLDDDCNVLTAEEILAPDDLPAPKYDLVIGWEDCRLFFWRGEAWCTATVRELNQEGYCEIVLSRLEPAPNNKRKITDYRVITPKFCSRQHEKNWMPMVVDDNLYFVYSSDPVRVIDINGNLVSSKITHFASDSFRGGGNVIPFYQGWLALIHESHTMPDNRRRYMHRFVWYDGFGKLSRYSPAFYIKNLGIEFSAGLAKHPTRAEIIASFGVHDSSSWLAVFDEDEVKKILQPSCDFEARFSTDLSLMTWLANQTNCALADKDSVASCKKILERANLPLHRDDPKNWDNALAIWHAATTTDLTQPVLDIAATAESAFLPSLAIMGYRNLTSINLTQKQVEIVNGIKYQYGDCTQTTFQDNTFGFISCLSVIEHGVDVEMFLRESHRILQPGGHLFISTDYWIDPVDTYGQKAFGAPVKVFTSDDIRLLVKQAESIGLRMTGSIQLGCKDRVVNWIGMNYTFINILFEKK